MYSNYCAVVSLSFISHEQASASMGYPVNPVNYLFTSANQKIFMGFTGFYIDSYAASKRTSQLDNLH
jgi:hypothetical protein